MKDKLLQVRLSEDLITKIEYLRQISGTKSTSETVRNILEKEYEKETVKVKKGKWMAIEYDALGVGKEIEAKPIHEEAYDISENHFVHCSVCKKTALLNGCMEQYVMSDYCPHCGAYMR